jgi:hypothetical protein
MKRAGARGSPGIALPDLAVAVADSEGVRALHISSGFDPDLIAKVMETLPPAEVLPAALSTDAREAVAGAATEASALGQPTVRPVHVWLAVLSLPIVRSALSDHRLDAVLIRQAIIDGLNM